MSGMTIAVAIGIGVPLGLAAGWYRRFSYAVEPFLTALNATPQIAFLPLIIVWAGTGMFAKVLIIKDNKYVYTAEPKTAKVEFNWKDTAPAAGKTSYYYVRGEQDNGEIVWASPMWITYTGK